MRQMFLRGLMTLLVAASLLSAGFAHRNMTSIAEVETLQTLAALGFTAADLCAESGEDGTPVAMGDCPVCHLAGSILLPQTVETLVAIELRAAAAIFVPAQARGLERITNPATPVRAPPLA